MSLPALTHHDIVRLVEPFARQGRLVDLAASDRAARRITFRTRDVPGGTAGPATGIGIVGTNIGIGIGAGNTSSTDTAANATGTPACRETLALDCRAHKHFILLRTLTPPAGPAATVRATGPDPADLLARVTAVPVAQLFSAGPGWCVARSYDTELPSGVRAPASQASPPLPPLMPPLVLSRAELQTGGLSLVLVVKLPGLRSVPADLTLRPVTGPLPALPEDLLAVLGWDWARLVPDKQGWTSKLRLRGGVLRRSRTAEAALGHAGAHLARVMAAPPGRFHDNHRLARWGVVLRRGLPTLTALGMVVGALLLTQFADRSNTGLWMALHYLPIALLALAFSLQELPQFEIPPLPRRSTAPHWGGADSAAAVRA